MQKISKEQSDLIWRLKGIAIFTVFFAHMPCFGVSETMNYIFSLLGMVGVPTFMIISGYLDYGSQFNLSKIVRNLFIPLILLGGGGYALSHYNSHLNFGELCIDLLKWLYGCGSWLYFVPVLFWCKIITRPHNEIYQYALMMISVVSIVLTSCNKIEYNDYFTPYTNPLNFLIYFQIGHLVRKYELNIANNILLFGALITMVLSLICWNDLPSYFSIFAIPVSLSAYVILYKIASIMQGGEGIGKLSYVIYLIHLVPVGIINRYGLKYIGAEFDFIKVPLAFAFIYLVAWLGKVCLKRLNKKLLPYFGYR